MRLAVGSIPANSSIFMIPRTARELRYLSAMVPAKRTLELRRVFQGLPSLSCCSLLACSENGQELR
jgi:hypothetical protein